MNIPGFTAQASLYISHERYHAQMSMAPNQQVIPQAINLRCWIVSASRTFFRCSGLGYGWGQCWETARDLANSVCDF
jgi:hypothetical protein